MCLANSRKTGGYCVAGKELVNDQPAGWIRPVSNREKEEISEHECRYEDGNVPQLLDIMNVPLLRPRLKPKSPQRENWLLDTNSCWGKDSSMHWRDPALLVDCEEPLWLNGENTYNGLNDRISLSSVGSLGSSLRFIRVDKLTLYVFAPGEDFGNPDRRVQGQFQHDGDEYHLWVTDPKFEHLYLKKRNGKYEIGASFLTVSLGESHDGYYYKFIAAIIPCDGATVE